MTATSAEERRARVAGHANHRWFALAVLGIAQLMVVLDATIVNVALPSIQRGLHFRPADLQWMVTSYTLAFGGFLLLGGRLADRLGRRRVFIAGALLFAFASFLGGIAPTPGVLIAARVLQGLGASVMSPSALSLLTVVFEEGKDRDRALGFWAAISAGGAAIGLILGGVLTQSLSWRWVLFVNVPIAAFAVIAATVVLPESKDEEVKTFDVAGAITVTVGLMALVFALVRGNSVGWFSGQTLGALAIAAVFLTAFIRIQRTATDPLLPRRVIGNSSVAGADIGALLVGAAIFPIFFFLSIYLQGLHHYGPIKTGFAFLPMTFIIGISAGISAQLLAKVGPRRILTVGMLIAALGLLLLARVSPHSSYAGVLLPAIALVAFGMGGSFVSLTSAAVAGVRKDDSGIASALLNAGQQVGGALGLAVLTAVSLARYGHVARQTAPGGFGDPGAYTSGLAWAFVGSAVLMVLAVVVAGSLVRVSKEDAAAALAHGGAAG